MQTRKLLLDEIMNRDKLSRLQILTFFLCFLVLAMDGFDVASAGYVAPLLKKLWGLKPPQLGAIFSAGLFGLALGKIGRAHV